jgi:hypothetical protein
MFGVVGKVIAGQGMDQYHQAFAIERQPQHDVSKALMAEGKLAAPVHMGPNQPFMDAAHLQAEQFRCLLTQGACLIEAIGVEIDVGVVALNFRHY